MSSAFLGAGVVIAFRLLRKLVRGAITLYISFNLGKVLGISAYWPDASKPAKGKKNPWEALSKYILRKNNTTLFVLGATGIATFGENHPLHDIINQFDGEVRILLMDPASAHLLVRAQSLGMTPTNYKREIARARAQIHRWQKGGKNIHYRMYDSVPNWKLILTKDVAWVQYYKTAQHVAGTPVYHFYATEAKTGLYHLFLAEFHRIWTLCDGNHGAPAQSPAVYGPPSGQAR